MKEKVWFSMHFISTTERQNTEKICKKLQIFYLEITTIVKLQIEPKWASNLKPMKNGCDKTGKKTFVLHWLFCAHNCASPSEAEMLSYYGYGYDYGYYGYGYCYYGLTDRPPDVSGQLKN